ncbi:MAG: DMT family transporter [Candidatus Thorarchaeota archaeon]
MSEEGEPKLQKYGPAFVSLANAARAFDAPVRYPLIFSSPGVVFPLENTPPMVMPRGSSFIALIEHFFGMMILLPILIIRRGFRRIFAPLKKFTRKDWLSLMYISFGGSALGLFFYLISFGLGNPTIAILIQKAQPLVTLLFAYVLLKEKLSYRFYITLFFALSGIILMVIPDIIDKWGISKTLGTYAIIAVLCSLLAAVFWGGSTVFGRILTEKVDYWNLTLFRYIGGFLFLIFLNIPLLTFKAEYFNLLGTKMNVFGYFDSDAGGFVPLDWQWYGGVCILYAAIFTGGVLPLALYYFGLKRSKAAIAGIAELAFPLLAIVVNYFFLGFGVSDNRTLAILQIIGVVILLCSVSILSYVNAKEMEKKTSTAKEKELKKGDKISKEGTHEEN